MVGAMSTIIGVTELHRHLGCLHPSVRKAGLSKGRNWRSPAASRRRIWKLIFDIADCFLVATGVSRSFGELDPDLLNALLRNVRGYAGPKVL